jgi:uncharacterized protein
MNIRKTLRWLHRDIGYFVVGITIIYTVSGIALNHRQDWNPHYSLISEEVSLQPSDKTQFTIDEITTVLDNFEYEPVYKKHFLTKNGIIKIFVEEGTVLYNPSVGKAELEILKKRPFFFQINKIHLAQAGTIWIWISDIMSVFLLFVAISGLFILKGKHGITGRGLWLTAIGVVIPLAVILLYVV